MFLSKRIKQAATQVRKFFERVAEDEVFLKNLSCLCWRASTTLAKRLQSKGFEAKVVHGEMLDVWGGTNYHVWVVYKNKILDITATQFGYRNKIFITSTKSKLYKPLKKAWPRANWPVEQRPRARDYAF